MSLLSSRAAVFDLGRRPRLGSIVRCAPGRNAATFQAFFDLVGERRHSIRAVSVDIASGHQQAIRDNLPEADVAFDPFRVVRMAQQAPRPGPPRRVERARALPHPGGQVDQGHGARCSKPREAHARAARQARRSPAEPLHRVFLLEETPPPLPAREAPPWRRRTSTPDSTGHPDHVSSPLSRSLASV
jgi:transposase